MKAYDHKHLWKSALTLLLALAIALSVCAAAFASSEAFDASTDDMTANALARALPLEGVPNAWQLGGYAAEDGRTVRENALLRTGALTNATEEDLKTLSEVYHVTQIVDFRSPMEKTQAPEPEVNGAAYASISLEDTQRQTGSSAEMAAMLSIETQFSDEPGRGEVEAIRQGLRGTNEDLYIEKITSEDIDAGIREFLDVLLAQEEDAVVLYHCKSGKDRTGVATMVLLTLLGVDKETVLADFDLTNVFLADDINAEVAQASQYTDEEDVLDVIRVMAGVSRDFMARAFDYAEEQSGSMLGYIKQRYHVTDEEIELLRDKFLEN